MSTELFTRLYLIQGIPQGLIEVYLPFHLSKAGVDQEARDAMKM